MSAVERMQKLLTASPKQLAQIDAVLNGETAADGKDKDLRVCTIVEAAKMLNVSRPTVYQMIKNGKLKTVRISDSNRVLVRSIAELVEGGAA